MKYFPIDTTPLDFDSLEAILVSGQKIELTSSAIERIRRCREYLDAKIANQPEPVYGITTGFGSLCNRNISPSDLSKLQKNLVVSHACGIGNTVHPQIVKLMLLLKAYALAQGKSGVQIETVKRLVDMFNHEVLPEVRELGSLGASGDLAPLAHLVLPLLGLGKVLYKGEWQPSGRVNNMIGWPSLELQSKEGLALLNGTQFMSAHAAHITIAVRRLMFVADVIGAMALEAYNGRIDPFLPEIHEIRPHKGQIETARNIRSILEGSQLLEQTGKAVQDPYSFRCIPQVHGAVKDTARYVGEVILTEINSVTDNPTIFPDEDKILSGGNFHGEPLAFAMDFLSIAMAELGNIAERRVYRLISGQRGLPEFLVAHPGLNSGFMIPQYAAASVVSQNKQLCSPSSVDSITSSNEQEDHVSMGANAATKTLRVLHNLERILAVELLTSCQALQFRGIHNTSPYLQRVAGDFRNTVPFVTDDVLMYELIDRSIDFVTTYSFPPLSDK